MTLRQASCVADLELRWANLYAESVMLQYDITCSDVKTAFLTESASAEDVNYIMEGAIGDLVSGIGEAIKKIFEAVVKFVGNIIEKITSLGKSKDAAEKLDRVKAIKNDPRAQSVKIEVEDTKERAANLEAYRNAIASAKAKIKNGQTLSAEDAQSLQARQDKCKSVAKKVTVSAVSVALAAGAVFTGIKASPIVKDYRNKYKDIETEYVKSYAKNDRRSDKFCADTSSPEYIKEYKREAIKLAYHEALYKRLEAEEELKKTSLFNRACAALARFIDHRADYSRSFDRDTQKDIVQGGKENLKNLKNKLRTTRDDYDRDTSAHD